MEKSKDVKINPLDIEVEVKSLNYMGLIAGAIQDINLVEKIDKILPLNTEKGVITTNGQRVSAMIMNGLGFMNDRLYMVQEFFNDKPMEKLFNGDVKAEHFNDDALGRALDGIYEYGTTKFFANISYAIGIELNLIGNTARHDTTSISVTGAYDELSAEQKDEYNEDFSLEYGHSKDHRPDLKQFILGLTTTGVANFPIWLEVLSGNESDKKSFHETKLKIEKFQKEIKYPNKLIFILDAAFYNKEKLISYTDSQWITRVPGTVKEVRKLLEKEDDISTWIEIDSNYRYRIEMQKYGDVTHKWKIVYSKDAHKNELITLQKKIEKHRKEALKKINQLMKEDFRCSKDALKAGKKLSKKLKYFNLEYEDKKGAAKIKKEVADGGKKYEEIEVFRLDIKLIDDDKAQEKARNKAGKFIIATNITDTTELADKDMLASYKSLSGTEKGFKFLKDSSFHASSVFLKTPGRIQALMTIMTLCLMIYNIAENRLRTNMKKANETLPNQVKKEVKNPTFKWIAQMMRSIAVTYCYDGDGNFLKASVSNVNKIHKKIINLFGGSAIKIYELE